MGIIETMNNAKLNQAIANLIFAVMGGTITAERFVEILVSKGADRRTALGILAQGAHAFNMALDLGVPVPTPAN